MDRGLVAFRDALEEVESEMHPAALPRRTGEVLADRCFEAFVGVRDDEPDTGQAAAAQAAAELAQNASERFEFGVADGEAEDFPVTAGSDAGRDHDGFRHDLAEGGVADVDVGGIEVDVGEGDVAEGTKCGTRRRFRRGVCKSATPPTSRYRCRHPRRRRDRRQNGSMPR